MSSELRVDKIVPIDGVPSGGGGGIIQVVHDTYSTESSSSSGNYAASGLTLNITPKFSTSKILVCFNLPLQSGAHNLRAAVGLHRGGSQIYLAQRESLFNGSSSNNSETVSGMFLDSPATTSTLTYDVRVRVSGGSGTFYWAVSSTVCTLTAMEVSA